MPVPVRLEFSPPSDEDIEKLVIWEGPAADGPFLQIEEVTVIGSYPDYIDHYTTTFANTLSDWFSIQWVDSKGAESPLSVAIQGGTTSLIAKLVDRMLLRDSSLNEIIAYQEAEAVISEYFNVADPFEIDPSTVSPKVLSGLTNLALVRSYVVSEITTSQTNKWSAGIVSMDSSSSAKSLGNLKELLLMAYRDLGMTYSRVLRLKELTVAGGFKRTVAVDLSRNIIEVQ